MHNWCIKWSMHLKTKALCQLLLLYSVQSLHRKTELILIFYIKLQAKLDCPPLWNIVSVFLQYYYQDICLIPFHRSKSHCWHCGTGQEGGQEPQRTGTWRHAETMRWGWGSVTEPGTTVSKRTGKLWEVILVGVSVIYRDGQCGSLVTK